MSNLSTDSRLRFITIWYAIGVVLLLIVGILSLIPVPAVVASLNDKLMHFFTYAGLAGWFSLLVPRRNALFFVGAALVVYGIIIEGLQGLTIYRYLEAGDILANSLGVFFGIGLYFSPLYHWFEMVDNRMAEKVGKIRC